MKVTKCRFSTTKDLLLIDLTKGKVLCTGQSLLLLLLLYLYIHFSPKYSNFNICILTLSIPLSMLLGFCITHTLIYLIYLILIVGLEKKE